MGFRERRLTAVGPEQASGILRLCGQDPVMGLPLAQQIMRWRQWGRGDVVVLGRPAAPRAAAWATNSLMPFGLATRPELGHTALNKAELRTLAEHARPRLSRRGSVMGPDVDVQTVWPQLQDAGMRALAERWNQPLLLAPEPVELRTLLDQLLRERPNLAPVAAALRPAAPGEEEIVLPASVEMFIHEVGYDPLTSGGAYARHVGELVRMGRSYIVLDDGAGQPVPPGTPGAQVAFKADLGCLWQRPPDWWRGGVGQVTGVWTRPDLRGRGIAAVALARMVERVRAEHLDGWGQVSLYANAFNTAALGLYDRLGFTRHGTFATVLL
ncbi:Predicted acetyltransferase [Actinomyces bovis]|uniref:Predicted acetyltransferase n=1 Tax=Actinomyces bovis TaxID=1658 RepID=A0ABY1VMD1_9ACTO|nr:GNAT family N-acetyltransferase [Actinomyces bovis]SPT52632.1 Predicted acetyltransferase [Actinomyces bovis]VEG54505.1 Predicted acetyltransferase [Actinomyces israelii]